MELNESDGMTEAHRTPTVAAKRDSKAVMGGNIVVWVFDNQYIYTFQFTREKYHSSAPWLQGHAIVQHHPCKMRSTFEASMLYISRSFVSGVGSLERWMIKTLAMI